MSPTNKYQSPLEPSEPAQENLDNPILKKNPSEVDGAELNPEASADDLKNAMNPLESRTAKSQGLPGDGNEAEEKTGSEVE